METHPFYPIWAATSSIEPNPLFRRKFLERTNWPWKYMDEFAGRYNARKLDTIDIMRLLFLGFEGRLLPWKKLVE